MQQKARELENRISDALSSMPPLPPKDQLESASDYHKRNQPWFDMEAQRMKPLRAALEELRQQLYPDSTIKPVFVSYDADAEVLTANISGGNCSFRIPRATAKEMHDSWSGVSVAHNNLGEILAWSEAGLADQPPKASAALALVPLNHVYVGYGKSTSAPRVITRANPEYSEEARAARLNGSVRLSIEINMDGKAENIKVTKSLGMGLDEKAIEAVQKWRFEPAQENCVHSRARAMVEVNFSLP